MLTYRNTFPSSITQARIVVAEAMEYLRAAGLDEELLGDLRLVFSELIINAITHGNNSIYEKDVNFTVDVTNKTVCATVTDMGDGFDVAAILRADSDLESEHGRGLRLIRALVDSLAFNETGNQIIVMKSR